LLSSISALLSLSLFLERFKGNDIINLLGKHRWSSYCGRRWQSWSRIWREKRRYMRRIQKPAQVLNILVLFGSICSEAKGLFLRAW
jgi:hypothetical protein